MAISGETTVRLQAALCSTSAAAEMVDAINASAGLPQALGPTDSPSFADLNLSGVLKVSGVDVVGTQQPAVALPGLVATAGALPTPNGSTTVADAGNPNPGELLDAIVELHTTVEALLEAVRTHGLIASS